jgi:hypothetical protein
VRWWVFIPVLALVLTMDAAFMPACSIAGHVPQLWPLLLAFVALYASRGSALWAAMMVGVWLDAMHPALDVGGDTPRAVTVFGPHILACAAGAWCVLESRTWLYRRNVLTVAFSTFNCALLASLAFIAIAGIRAAYADPLPLWGGGSGAAAVGSDMLDALYSAVIAILPAWGLQSTLTVWGFATAGPRFAGGNRMNRGND